MTLAKFRRAQREMQAMRDAARSPKIDTKREESAQLKTLPPRLDTQN